MYSIQTKQHVYRDEFVYLCYGRTVFKASIKLQLSGVSFDL